MLMPYSSECCIRLSTSAFLRSAFDGMQPQLRQMPSESVALDYGSLHAQLSGTDRGNIAAWAGAEHHYIIFSQQSPPMELAPLRKSRGNDGTNSTRYPRVVTVWGVMGRSVPARHSRAGRPLCDFVIPA